MITFIATLAAAIALAATPTAPPAFTRCIARGEPVVVANEDGPGVWVGIECHPSKRAIRHGAEPTWFAGLDLADGTVTVSVGP